MSEKYAIYLDRRNNIKIINLNEVKEYEKERIIGRSDYSSYDAAVIDLVSVKEKLGKKLTLLEKMKVAAAEVEEERKDVKRDEETANNIFRIYRNIQNQLVIVSCNPLHCTHIRNRFFSKERYVTEEEAMKDLIQIKRRLRMPLTAKEVKFEERSNIPEKIVKENEE